MFLVSVVLGNQSCLKATEYEAKVLEVKDGDTFVCNIVVGFDIVLIAQDVRVVEFDAWEKSRRRQSVRVTDDELVKGKLAYEDAVKILTTGKVTVEPQKPLRDVYGRLLLRVKVDGKYYDEIMKEKGHQRK